MWHIFLERGVVGSQCAFMSTVHKSDDRAKYQHVPVMLQDHVKLGLV
jgi:hypothetical protein